MDKKGDLTGKTFGRLYVKEVNKSMSYPNSKYVFWECICICGKAVNVVTTSLKNGTTLSCGCLRMECNKKVNEFKILKKYVVYKASNANKWFIIDKKDHKRVKKYCWYLDPKGYLLSRINGKLIRLHRFIMMLNDPKVFIDHKNRSKRDNRFCNLRKANPKESVHNRGIPKNNKSGFTGVHFSKSKNKWVSRIQNRHLGYFDSFEDAKVARIDAEQKIYKQFAPQS